MAIQPRRLVLPQPVFEPPADANRMGLMYGLEKSDFCIKKNHRWLFQIPGVSADDSPGVDALPPEKSARPSMSFKSMEVKHVIEDVYYPAKPEWKSIIITLYDLKKTTHPVFEWLKKVYDPKAGTFSPANRSGSSSASQQKDKFIKECSLKLFGGCGSIIEKWIFEDSWPESVNFQTLDMSSSSYLTCEISLKYARAYIDN